MVDARIGCDHGVEAEQIESYRSGRAKSKAIEIRDHYGVCELSDQVKSLAHEKVTRQ